jgi:Flp pilus assembly protein TadB
MIAGIFILLELTPEQIGSDIMSILHNKESLVYKAKRAQGLIKRSKIKDSFLEIQSALKATGSENKFTGLITASFFGIVGGLLLSILIGDFLVFPVMAVLSLSVPIWYARSLAATYNKQVASELETALSIITTSYMSNDDIIFAVENSVDYINPPIRDVFKEFLGKTKLINSNVRLAILQMKERINNEVFREWCDNLVDCQDSLTLKHTLQPIASRLSHIRIVNAELDTMLQNPRKEFFTLLALSIASVPLLFFLNREWFEILFNTAQGKITLGIVFIIWVVTTIKMIKVTQPMEIKR